MCERESLCGGAGIRWCGRGWVPRQRVGGLGYISDHIPYGEEVHISDLSAKTRSVTTAAVCLGVGGHGDGELAEGGGEDGLRAVRRQVLARRHRLLASGALCGEWSE